MEQQKEQMLYEYEPRKQIKEDDENPLKPIIIFIKYEYLSRGGDPSEELYDIKTNEETTIKEIKEELNTFFIYGELNPEQ